MPRTPPPPTSLQPRPAAVPRKQRDSGWRSVDILRAAALVMGLYLALRLLWLAHPLVLTAFLGILFGLAVSRGVDSLERFRIPRGIAATLIVFAFYGLIGGVIAWSAPTLRAQFGELRTRLPQAMDQVDTWLDQHRGGMVGQLLEGAPGVGIGDAGEPAQPAAPAGPRAQAPASPGAPSPGSSSQAAPAQGQPEGGSQLRNTLSSQLGAVGRYFFQVLSSTVAVLAGLLLITFIAIYIAADPGLYRKGMLHLVPHRARGRAEQVLTAIGAVLRRWLVSQLIAMVVIGVVTTVALLLLGVEAAVSLGIIAGLLEFIPNLGPLLSAVPAVAMGFLDSPEKALLVVAVYAGIQLLENHLLIPYLMKEGVDLPPVLTLIGQALMALVFGFLGLLVAVPLIAAAVVAVKILYVEGVVGDEMQVFEETD